MESTSDLDIPDCSIPEMQMHPLKVFRESSRARSKRGPHAASSESTGLQIMHSDKVIRASLMDART